MAKVLFVTPELHPFNKTGGLGDVSASLTVALHEAGHDVRFLLPGFPAIMNALCASRPVLAVMDSMGRTGCLLLASLDGFPVPAYVLDFPDYFRDRPTPYGETEAERQLDARRFHQFALGAIRVAAGQDPDWRPDVVHCNDWTTGLIPALLSKRSDRCATVFTIHNLAYQGLYPETMHMALGLPDELWEMHGLEFHGQLSFIKGGLSFADVISTVSRTYAREILTPAFGWGLDGLLRYRQDRLFGVLNGVDYRIWNPATDANLPAPFDPAHLSGKATCKQMLQQQLGLRPEPETPLLAVVSRLTEQKGIDLIAESAGRLLSLGTQLVVLGAGDEALERQLSLLSRTYPGQLAVVLGYDEALSHQIVAAADMFLLPSHFEPCGLTQLYSMKYGTVPIAHRTGGLADTVIDVDEARRLGATGTGFSYLPNTPAELYRSVERAVGLYRRNRGRDWQRLRATLMDQDFGWARSASAYTQLFETALTLRDAAIAQPGGTRRSS